MRYDKFLREILKGLVKLLQILFPNYSRDVLGHLVGCFYPRNKHYNSPLNFLDLRNTNLQELNTENMIEI